MDRLTPAQIRGARGMLNWSMVELAKASQLSVATIKRMEMASPQPVSDDAYARVLTALKVAGARFLFDGGKGEGIWFDYGYAR